MQFHAPLIKGSLIKRYKRFMADVELESGEIVTAHCANSGSMLSVDKPGSEVWLSPAKNTDRKLKFTWELIRCKNFLVGVNTHHPNTLVTEAIQNEEVPELNGFSKLQREVKYGENSRIDILLQDPKMGLCYVEVKNVTMRRDLSKETPVEFPDAVTSRGTKHLVELSAMVKAGHRAVMFYLVQRGDSSGGVAIASDIDPLYRKALYKAQAAGVQILAYGCAISTSEIKVTNRLKFLG
ncbi:MAG: DNA/RNA nuclease SfsA [Magnetovibrio sp.]|nr:DNA/RNA nuclease SfsA [Magnetovibrio sp.]|tara:strand:+ start:2391 stop:3104 length:714 start_codon:yes stop_codon:yes gene_type:complete